MVILCGMPTLQYSARRARLSVHKLFTTCIRRGLASRDSIVDGDWLPAITALSAVLSTRVGRHRKFRDVFCTKCTVQGNDFELIPTVQMEARNPVEGYIGSEFPAICYHFIPEFWRSEVARR